ncbi:MAG: hypothetical protein JO021_03305 [Alphaproteobacteria bacterium]|nr:hypothetical protein [Alphaproteobacteria bacterium]
MSAARVIPIFAASFAVLYVLAVEGNWALVTYHPRLNEWEFLTQPARSGPAMYWYGWLGTCFLGAAAASLAALPLTRRWAPPVWIGWAIPLAVMVVFVYLLRSFFLV